MRLGKVVSVLYDQVHLCDFDFVLFYILDMKEDSDNVHRVGLNHPNRRIRKYSQRLFGI